MSIYLQLKTRKPYNVFLLLIVLCLTFSPSFGQNPATVSGIVTDEENSPIIGATVVIKGTNTGTTTGIDGEFKLVSVHKNAVLIISYIGYKTLEIPIGNKSTIEIVLQENAVEIDEVVIVAYGAQKKETLTGAISSVKTDDLLRSPNASVANSLAGKVSGLSSVSFGGAPGQEDPEIYVRGTGTLSAGGSTPLILVDGIERSFYQLDPNEIDNITVLKDASATAVFGVRGANGVILVTTRRGTEKKTSISVTSSVGMQMPTRMLKPADSYTFAMMRNEMSDNDDEPHIFSDYDLERFRLKDEPILYPDVNWREYLMRKASVQTQHNINISGGTDRIRYFTSLGYMFQNGLFKQFETLDYNNNYKYNRYNFRTNLDVDITKSTLMKIGIGGIVGDTHEPNTENVNDYGIFKLINWTMPMSSPGIVDDKFVLLDANKYPGIYMANQGMIIYYGKGYTQLSRNTMNLDLSLTQKLDMVTKGLSAELKGGYNTTYTFRKHRAGDSERYRAYYQSEIDKSGLLPGDPGYNYDIVYRIEGLNNRLAYTDGISGRTRDWYIEGSLRYARKFGDHNISSLLLFNEHKKYYPGGDYNYVPVAYAGIAGRVTYDYKTKYLAEFNIGYNGSENFAREMRFGTFPAFSLGYILTGEEFMENQKVFQHIKLRASVGLVGNDIMSNARFMYYPTVYEVDRNPGVDNTWGNLYGYNFGYNSQTMTFGATEGRMGNPNVTWETALKQNYGIDLTTLNSRLNLSVDLFREDRKDILISRNTIPVFTSLNQSLLPSVNMGEVKNEGFEAELKWSDGIRSKDFRYWVNTNISYNKNTIIFQDEVVRNEPYMWRTGKSIGTIFGYVCDGFYTPEDFNSNGELLSHLPKPEGLVKPGDAKYKDLNNDTKIDANDVKDIGYPVRPRYTFGFNYGVQYKGFSVTMNWTGAAQRSLLLSDDFRNPFSGGTRALLQFHVDDRWTPETAHTAKTPRLTSKNTTHNTATSSLWVKNGDFLRLKSMDIGYTFSNRRSLKKLGISQLGIKFSGYNLLTFSNFDIMDPESRPNANDTYPTIKIFNMGVNLTF